HDPLFGSQQHLLELAEDVTGGTRLISVLRSPLVVSFVAGHGQPPPASMLHSTGYSVRSTVANGVRAAMLPTIDATATASSTAPTRTTSIGIRGVTSLGTKPTPSA